MKSLAQRSRQALWPESLLFMIDLLPIEEGSPISIKKARTSQENQISIMFSVVFCRENPLFSVANDALVLLIKIQQGNLSSLTNTFSKELLQESQFFDSSN